MARIGPLIDLVLSHLIFFEAPKATSATYREFLIDAQKPKTIEKTKGRN